VLISVLRPDRLRRVQLQMQERECVPVPVPAC
jgi:hypothetical protein